MKRSISLMAFWLLGISRLALAYEYPLQFTPNPGYRGLIVAGYKFQGNNVVGNCSYLTVSGAPSGKGGGGRTPVKIYAQTCTWDMHGNLLSVTPGAPAIPRPIATKGSQIIYAIDANGNYTGTDIKLPQRGFVSSPGAHYTWLTPNNNGVLRQIVYTLTATLKSDGDVTVDISNVTVSALLGLATLKQTDCNGEIKVGDKCSVTLTYDPSSLTSATGLAADTLRIDLTSDAGEAVDFIQNLTVILPQKLD
jgi:hypothetical protein